jgi:hypothetical protein
MNANQALARTKQRAALIFSQGTSSELAYIMQEIEEQIFLGSSRLHILFYEKHPYLEAVATILRSEGYKITLRGQAGLGDPISFTVSWGPDASSL